MDNKELGMEITEKLEKHSRMLSEHHANRVRGIMLKQERESLRLSDTQRNLEVQKWQQEQRKMQVWEKHARMTDKLIKMK